MKSWQRHLNGIGLLILGYGAGAKWGGAFAHEYSFLFIMIGSIMTVIANWKKGN